jgi:hypothetical protein
MDRLEVASSISTVPAAEDFTTTVGYFNNTYDNGTNGTTAYTVLRLRRDGVTGVSYGNSADFGIARYEAVGTNSRSRLDIRLGHGLTNTTDTTVMTLLSSGAVGIGTTSPGYKLATNGSIGLGVASNGTNQLVFDGSIGGDAIGASAAVQGTYTNFGTNSSGALLFLTNSSSVLSEKVRIRSDGMFEVKGAGVSGSSPAFSVNGSAPANSAIIDSSGRLLVGTSSASSAGEILSVKEADPKVIIRASSGNPSLRFYDSNDSGADSCQINYYDNTALSIEVIPALPMKFLTTNTERMTIAAGGAVNVVGALSKGSGSFRIDHPLPEKKDTHQLVHSFIEGPQVDLIYRGHVNLINGKATINIDETSNMTNGTFEALCRDICCFTSNETDWTSVRGHVDGNILAIEAQDLTSTAEVCWMVIGERKDQHIMDTDWTDENGRVITEPLKEVTLSVTP